ncbi:MAG: cytochrome c biogenesis protein CcdA [Candidatus Magnetoovum sp. WYHC-5]|nr:cytochrome c biogenesis protein CcdA [Candidatus Magnetoovum sp. WYHC-5]
MDLTLVSVFTAGLLTFFAPCVLPIVPAYLSVITGVQAHGKSEDEKWSKSLKMAVPVVFFVFGFSFVFVLMGATATAIGTFLIDYQREVSLISGTVVIFFGMHFINVFLSADFWRIYAGCGLFCITLFAFGLIDESLALHLAGAWTLIAAMYLFKVHELLYRQLKSQGTSRSGVMSSFVIGIAFGAGWSPCIGTVLGTVLLLAAKQDTLYQGMLFLALFSLGLGIPFIIAGIFWSGFLRFIRHFGRFFALVELLGGVLLIGLGILLLTGNLELLAME